MKKNYLLLSILVLMPFFASCTSDDVVQKPSGTEKIVLKARNFKYVEDADSRTILQESENEFAFSWNNQDIVGVFPSQLSNGKRGSQLAFYPVQDEQNPLEATVAKISGLGWGIQSEYTYAAFYPCTNKVTQDPNKIEVDYSYQIQTANQSTAHLGEKDFMAAKPVTTSGEDKVTFLFDHLGSLIKLNFSAPDNFPYGFDISFTEIPTKGIVNLFAQSISVTSQGPSDSRLTLRLNGNYNKNQEVTAYLMIPACNMSGKKIVMYIDKWPFADIKGKDYKAGEAYPYNFKASEPGPEPGPGPEPEPEPEPEPQTGWIDLGTGVLWAEKNLGATDENPNGKFYTFDEKNSLTFNDGSRLPSKKDFEDILNKISYDSNQNQVIFTNGTEKMSLPMAGTIWADGGSIESTDQGRYWTNSQTIEFFKFGSSWTSFGPDNNEKLHAMPIRLVKDKSTK